MVLARVIGTVVATRKDPRLEGMKLLIVRPISPQGQEQSGHMVAVDTVGAGVHERVLIVQGSSARMPAACQDRPVDAAIIGIVDSLQTED